MIVPIGDQPNPRGTPWVTYGLVAVNVAVFLFVSLPFMGRPPDVDDPATREYLRHLLQLNPETPPRALVWQALQQLTAYDVLVYEWGYLPAAPRLLDVVASMFLHGGWLHLIGNMLFLWIYGDNVEHRLGRAGFLAAYLVTGALAAVGYGAFVAPTGGYTPMIGASGAISGVLGLYFVWFPRNKVRLLVLLFPFFFDVFLVSARIVLGFYLVIENLLPFLIDSGGGGGVAHGAHIGGFVAGLLGAWGVNVLGRRGEGRRVRGVAAASSASEPGGELRPDPTHRGAWQDVELAFRSGRPATAVQRYLAVDATARRTVPVAVVAELAEWLVRDRQADAALALYRRALADHPHGPHRDRLLLGAGLALLHGKDHPTAAYPYLLDALDADPAPEVEATAREALREIERRLKLRITPRRW